MKKRNKHIKTEYEKARSGYRKVSDRHVVVFEIDMTEEEKRVIFHDSDVLRKAGNDLTAIILSRYEQLIRTKRYRALKELYGKYSGTGDEEKVKSIATQMAEMQTQYNVTWEDCRKEMIKIGEGYKICSIFALSRAEDVWSGIEGCLYRNGKSIHFSKHGDLPVIRAKQMNRGIIIKPSEEKLSFSYNGIKFNAIIKDRFEEDEKRAIISYLKDPEAMDMEAVLKKDKGVIISTYRPCYASLVCKEIRGRLRVYIHITVEGKPVQKFRRDGSPRHKYGTGNVGCDIGTQTIAYTSDHSAGLENLAERGTGIRENERKERLILRAMDRSRRATNPQNYNSDGTVKKGPKKWKKSKRYRKLEKQYKEMCRINAINRHLAIRETVNHIRELGDVFITEPKNAKKLQKRAKQATDENGKQKRRKRFGKSIKNRCPGYFQAYAKEKFERTGGKYMEVPQNYRASQYDHTSGEYYKKKLSDRMYSLPDGTVVQRDWYSSYLLYCINPNTMDIDKKKCLNEFSKHYEHEKNVIRYIKASGIKIMNSGIHISKMNHAS